MPVNDDEEAISIANDSKYALGAIIVSEDLQKAEKMALRIEAGMTFVNQTVKSDSRLPAGGFKETGYGRECGKYGFEEFTNIKLLYIQ